MLNHRYLSRETAVRLGWVMAKSGRLEQLGDNVYGNRPAKQSNSAKNAK